MTAGTISPKAHVAVPRPRPMRAGKAAMAFSFSLALARSRVALALPSSRTAATCSSTSRCWRAAPSAITSSRADPGWPVRIGSLVVAAMGLRHARLAPFLAFAIGCAQMIWIVVELAIIKEFSILHPIMFGVGLVIAISGRALGLADVPGLARPLDALRRSVCRGS